MILGTSRENIFNASHARKSVKSLETAWCKCPKKDGQVFGVSQWICILSAWRKQRKGQTLSHAYLRYQEVWAVSLKQISQVLRRGSWSHCCRGYLYWDCRSSHNWQRWKGCCTNSASWELCERGGEWQIIQKEPGKGEHNTPITASVWLNDYAVRAEHFRHWEVFQVKDSTS